MNCLLLSLAVSSLDGKKEQQVKFILDVIHFNLLNELSLKTNPAVIEQLFLI